jgi:hypothetical protein
VQFGVDNLNITVVGPGTHGCDGIQLIEMKNP